MYNLNTSLDIEIRPLSNVKLFISIYKKLSKISDIGLKCHYLLRDSIQRRNESIGYVDVHID